MNSYSSVLNTLLVVVIIVASLFLAHEVLLSITLAAILSFKPSATGKGIAWSLVSG
jgi:hypothetical protein